MNDLEILNEIKRITKKTFVQKSKREVLTDTYNLDARGAIVSLVLNELTINEFNLVVLLIKKLNSLTNLSLKFCNIEDTNFLRDLPNLVVLELIFNQISEISSLSTLNNLETLSLYNNKITDITALKDLHKIKDLNLSQNRIKDISPLKNLTRISSLIIRENKITDILPISELKGLKILDISVNRVENLNHLQELTNLKRLVLHNCNISSLCFIEKLLNIRELFLGENQIKELDCLSNLKNITSLYLFKNLIRDITPLKELKKLKILVIDDNKIESLPPWLLDLNLTIGTKNDHKYNYNVSVGNNPLVDPPAEIINQGKGAIKAWFDGAKTYINEVKVLLVGHGEAGKTTLVKALRGEKIKRKEPPTHHIKISSHHLIYKGKEVKLNFWDFGGQEVMHSTHQFFLSQRSIYILVLDGRKDEDPEYWLKLIESFGGDSPVLVVLNKIDTNPGFDVDRRFLKEKYSFIEGFYKTVCIGKKIGIESLKKGLEESLDKVPILSTPWPLNWLPIKTSLEDMPSDFISQSEYDALCTSNNIFESGSRDILASYLNDLGVIVHFKDIRLHDLHILQPRWASRAAYKIINHERISKNSGILQVEWMTEIMKKEDENDFVYSKATFPYILDLMQKFELCFPININQYLLPELMDIQQPELPTLDGPILRFHFVYEDLFPKSIMPRFIVRMHEDILENFRWRTGVVLNVPLFKSIAIVIADTKEKKISIAVNGPQRREHFAIIRKTFHSLNNNFEKLKVSEWIPLPDVENHAIEYDELIGYEESYLEEVFVGKLKKRYKVKDLLNGIELENVRKKEFKWDVFICHSSVDKPIIRKITSDFKKRNIDYWLDEEQIEPGDNTIDKITEGLQFSKYIVPCISNNQIKSGWSRNEYQSILSRVIAGMSNQKVVPLILDELPDEQIPLLLNNVRYEHYQSSDEYEVFLEFLSNNVQ